tara:strand:- start:1476 stop:1946 length:471 start_codon:yes stop_codon:yes gene_type:complete
MFKIFFTLIIFLLISNCGFQKISEDRINNFQIENFITTGDRKMAAKIKNNILINSRNESKNLISLTLDLNRKKSISEKNSANQITKYLIEMDVQLVLVNEINNKIEKFKINKSMSYNVEDTYTQTLRNEKQILSDLSGKITEEILRYIYMKNLNGN